MLTKKVLMNTFGAKIAPYGFHYNGFQAHRWSFSRTINEEEQYVVVQRDIHGGTSFKLELPRGLNENENLADLTYHCYEDDEELESLLNLLGDHFVVRVLPELAKPKERLPEYVITDEMYLWMENEKEKLAEQFMQRYGLDWESSMDEVLGKVLSEVEQMRGKGFHGQKRKLVELASVLGEVFIRTIGGEWMWKPVRRQEEIIIGNVLFTEAAIRPLIVVCDGWREGAVSVMEYYMAYLSDYRVWVAEQRDEYGSEWQPPQTVERVNESLLHGRAVEKTIGKKMVGAGFVYRGEKNQGWVLEKVNGGKRETIEVREDAWGRKAFFAIHSITGGGVAMYRYREFCFYRDELDMRLQLNRVGDRMREAFRENRRQAAVRKLPNFRYHLTEEDEERFRMEEGQAFVVSSVHMDTESTDRKEPNHKIWKSKYQKEVRFTPDSIVLTNNKGTRIELTDKEGIHMISEHSVVLEAAEDLTISSQSGSLMVAGTSSVSLQQKKTSIQLKKGISFTGGELKVQ